MSQGSLDRIAERERVAKFAALQAKKAKKFKFKRTTMQKAAANGELGSLDDLIAPEKTDAEG